MENTLEYQYPPQEVNPGCDWKIYLGPICDELGGLANNSTLDVIEFLYKSYG